MKVFQNGFEAGKWAPGSVAAIGKFDGMHLGHQKLIQSALEKAKASAQRCMILTFDPHPKELFEEGVFKPIFSLAEKLQHFKRMGADAAVLLPFTQRLACMASGAFARDVLAGQLKVSAVFVGEDFCFGKDRSGRVETLEELGPSLGFTVHSVPLLVVDGEKVSSSRIRELIARGDRKKAEELLGRSLIET